MGQNSVKEVWNRMTRMTAASLHPKFKVIWNFLLS